MKYIDKERYHDEAHAINVRFLKDCYEDLDNPYPSPKDSSLFDDFSKPDYAYGKGDTPGWRPLLHKEQDGRCCYCMRRLSEERTKANYEHVIPRSLRGEQGQEEYAYYTEHAPALRDFVEMADVFAEKKFASKEDLEQEEKMPHTIALANLLAACNGVRDSEYSRGCCCNHDRSDGRILPIMLMGDAADRVRYDENGILSIVGGEASWGKIIDGLNNETLQEIRSIWYHISQTGYTPEAIRTLYEGSNEKARLGELIELFKNAYGMDDLKKLPKGVQKYVPLDISASFYPKTLLAYDWFYAYYRRGTNNYGN